MFAHLFSPICPHPPSPSSHTNTHERTIALPLLHLHAYAPATCMQPRPLAPCVRRVGSGLFQAKAGWETTASSPVCPCSNASLCRPVTREGPEGVYAFHVGRQGPTWKSWKMYDWDQVRLVMPCAREPSIMLLISPIGLLANYFAP